MVYSRPPVLLLLNHSGHCPTSRPTRWRQTNKRIISISTSNDRRIMPFTPSGRPETPVFLDQLSHPPPQGNPLAITRLRSVKRLNVDFRPINRYILETIEDRHIVTIENQKSLMRAFDWYTNFDDLERSCTTVMQHTLYTSFRSLLCIEATVPAL